MSHTPTPWGLCHHLKSPEHDAACGCGYRGAIWSADGSYIVLEMGSSPDVDETGAIVGHTQPQADRATQLADAAFIIAAVGKYDNLLAAVRTHLKWLESFDDSTLAGMTRDRIAKIVRAEAAKLRAAVAPPTPHPAAKGPLFEIGTNRAGKEPCGECHIQPGETCDICGASYPALEANQQVKVEADEIEKALDELEGLKDGLIQGGSGIIYAWQIELFTKVISSIASPTLEPTINRLMQNLLDKNRAALSSPTQDEEA